MSAALEHEFYPTPISQIRKKEYPLLNKTTYLDHAGTTIYSRSLVNEFSNLMKENLLGNPHSKSPSSSLATHYVETARHRMLRFFRADPEHFDLIFVANATAAIKMVAEGVRDEPLWYGYHADAHTSLVGIRQLANAGSRCFMNDSDVEQWLSQGPQLPVQEKSKNKPTVGLFAYPGQSNMNGRRLPLDWAGRLRRAAARSNSQMYTLFDAAALVSSTQLDLSDHVNAPDFTALSFYKIFGFPDLGALIVRKKSGHVLLKRSYFGGGTVEMVIHGKGGVDAWHSTRATSLHEGLEDGTAAFHNIAALHCAVDVQERLFGSMTQVSQHANHLASVLYDQMCAITHSNGRSMCVMYNSRNANYRDRKTQGPTIAFNVRDVNGKYIGKNSFEQIAIEQGIQLRTGGVCNPGGIAQYLDMTAEEMRRGFKEGLRCGNEVDTFDGKPTGIVRVSFGAMSSMRDVESFMSLLQLLVDKETSWGPLQVQQTECALAPHSGHSGHSGHSAATTPPMSEKQDFGSNSSQSQTNFTMQKQTPSKMRGTFRRLMCF
ncbi:MAG: hypothetical protein Q9216_005013 [Gyalolechia sp. 2 TL-2023]